MGTWRRTHGHFRPWEPPAGAATGDAGSIYASIYDGGASWSDADGGRAVVEPLPMERDLLSRFTGEGGPRLQEQDNRQPPPTPTLSLRLGFEEEQENRVDATIHGRAPQQAWAAAAATRHGDPVGTVRVGTVKALPAPCRASVGEPSYSPLQHILPGGASAPPPTYTAGSSSAGLASRRPPRAPLHKDHSPQLAGPMAQQDRNVRDLRTRALGPELQGRRDVAGGAREMTADVAHRPDCRRAAPTSEEEEAWSLVRRVNGALAAAGLAAVSTPARMQRICADVGIRCRACRIRPPDVVLEPRVHLCLCGDCADAFRDDPDVACPVCPAVPAWSIRM